MARADSQTPSPGPEDGTPLPRSLGMTSAALAVIGIIVGAGIFRAPTLVAAQVGDPWVILALWLLGGILVLGLGLLMAELGSASPGAGGLYVFLREAFGPAIAFVYGWTSLLIAPAAWSALAVTAADFLGYIFPIVEPHRKPAAIAMILGFCLITCWSTVVAASVQSIATLAKIFALVALAALLMLAGPNPTSELSASPAAGGLGGVLAALVLILWAYDGIATFSGLAGEVREPQRNLPRAILLGLGTVTAIFLLINAALLNHFSAAELTGSALPLSDTAERLFGQAGSRAITIVMFVAAVGSLVGCVLADPRVVFAMGRDGSFPGFVGAIWGPGRTPAVAIVLSSVVASLYVAVHDLAQLAAVFVLGLVPFYALAGAAVLRLRRQGRSAKFKAPAAPFLAATWMVVAALLIGNALIETPMIAGLNIAITLAGFPVYWLWRAATSVSSDV